MPEYYFARKFSHMTIHELNRPPSYTDPFNMNSNPTLLIDQSPLWYLFGSNTSSETMENNPKMAYIVAMVRSIQLNS